MGVLHAKKGVEAIVQTGNTAQFNIAYHINVLSKEHYYFKLYLLSVFMRYFLHDLLRKMGPSPSHFEKSSWAFKKQCLPHRTVELWLGRII